MDDYRYHNTSASYNKTACNRYMPEYTCFFFVFGFFLDKQDNRCYNYFCPWGSSPGNLNGPFDAGWSSQVARRAHNPEVAGSNPAPATSCQ